MRRFAAILGFLLAVGPVGPADARQERLDFELVTQEQGLLGMGITGILQDRYGYLWFASLNGLQVFDGFTFRDFRNHPSAPAAVRFGTASDVCESPDGGIWISSDDGLIRYDRLSDSFEHYRRDPADPTSLSTDNLLHIACDADGNVWAGSWSAGLNKVVRGSGTVDVTRHGYDPTNPISLSSDYIGRSRVGPDGWLWVGTGRGLDRLDRESGRATHYLLRPEAAEPGDYDMLDYPGYPVDALGDALPDPDGSIWVGRGDGLFRFWPETGTVQEIPLPVPPTEGVQRDWVHRLARDPSGHLWVGTQTGLYEVDPAGRTPVRHDLPRANERSVYGGFALSLLVDRSGVLWVGTDGWVARVDLFDRKADRIELERNGNVSAFAASLDGTMWIGTTTADLHRFYPSTHRAVRVDAAMNLPKYRVDAAISALSEGDDGTLWVGSYLDGLRGFRSGTGSVVSLRHDPGDPMSLDSDSVLSIRTDESGTVWVATNRGLNRMVRGAAGELGFMHHDRVNDDGQSMRVRNVIEVLLDRDGAIWLRTGQGLLDLDRTSGEFHAATMTTAVSGQRGRFADAVSAWQWLLGIQGPDAPDPLSAAVDEKTRTLLAQVGGPDCVVVDNRGTAWMSTRHGVLRVTPDEGIVRHYGREKGLEPTSFSRSSTCGRGGDGRVYFAGRPGAYLIEPETFRDNPYLPSSLITGLAIRDRLLVPGVDAVLPRLPADMDAVVLPHYDNDVTVSFLAVHYSWPDLNTFQVRLLEYDDMWRSIGQARTARFTSLQPGSYRFQVRALTPIGVAGEPATLGIEIRPPWWRTPWAYAVYFLFGLAAAVAITQYRERRLRRRASDLQAEVDAQTRDLDRARQHAERQARRLQELDRAKSHFFANISHEFRTPLTLILGPLQDFADGRARQEQLHGQVPIMRRSARRLLALINELLELSSLEAGELQLRARPTDLVPFVRGLTLAFSSMAERERLDLTFETDLDGLETWIDRDKMERVVSNLLANALKFTPPGGTIRATVGADDSHAIICVSDTGPGISAEQLPRVFDRFYQVDSSTSRPHEGTGIGLALARELVERHRGTISVDSAPGKGATFAVRLPLGADYLPESDRAGDREPDEDHPASIDMDELVHAAADVTTQGAEQAEKPVILVVEDNADLRSYLTGKLNDMYTVHSALDGKEGLDRARSLIPDLIVTDIMMPRMDGYALCRALKGDDDLSAIPVVMLTARADEESKLEGLGVGADDYLPKPFSVDELRARVRNLLESRARLRDRFSGEVFVRPDDILITPEEEVFLERVLAVINEHLADSSFSVDWLADAVDVSRRHLERHISASTGASPAALIRRLRVMRAQQLLRARAGTVSEIAYMVGFRQPSHFATVFRKETGVTPTDYRDQAEVET